MSCSTDSVYEHACSNKLTIEDFQRAKECLMKGTQYIPMPPACTAPCCPPTHTPYTSLSTKLARREAEKKSMETTMNTYTNITADATDKNVSDAKDHLVNRIAQAYGEKNQEINKIFHLSDDERPKSAKEFLERMKTGMYVLPKKVQEEIDDEDEDEDEDGFNYFSPHDFMYQIRWRNPAVKADEVGAKAAREKLVKAYEATIDTARVMDPKEGLEALRTFQTYTLQ